MIQLEDFFNEKVNLPSPPATALLILDAVREDSKSLDELVKIISADPSLTARTLKAANSALYGLPRAITSLNQATVLIGTEALKNIALSFVIVQEFKHCPEGSFDLNLFWRRAITAAVAAETLAKYTKQKSPNIFITALLQDIGILVMFLSDSVTYTSALDEKRATGKRLSDTEMNQFGFNHTHVGFRLLDTWGLPESISEPIRLHHSDDPTEGNVTDQSLLRLGDQISSMYHGTHPQRKFRELRRTISQTYRLTENEIELLFDDIGAKSSDMIRLFQVPQDALKPASQMMKEAREEADKLSLSYKQMTIQLRDAKESSERLATELKDANTKINELAFKDGLTGLHNHRFFQDALDVELSHEGIDRLSVSLLLLDLDYFRIINESYGHLAGDFILKKVARFLKKSVRSFDIVARFGGEEFALVLPETHADYAEELATRLITELSTLQIEYNGQMMRVTASVGISCSTPYKGPTTREKLIEQAEEALLSAKNNGRNRVEVFGEVPCSMA